MAREVRMEHTNGLGKEAKVWVSGNLLTVCDGVSPDEGRCPPGEMESVKFSYMNVAGFSWDDAIRGNPSRRNQLEPTGRWSYVGYGKVLSVMPVLVDFGLLQMEDANWTTDEQLVGKYVRIPIDRLEISNAVVPDWPENAR